MKNFGVFFCSENNVILFLIFNIQIKGKFAPVPKHHVLMAYRKTGGKPSCILNLGTDGDE
jgi:hypothetical protein